MRPVAWDEVASFKEVAACGTAVVLTPISSITRGDQKVSFESFDTIARLYEAVTAIQVGEAEDVNGYSRRRDASARGVLSRAETHGTRPHLHGKGGWNCCGSQLRWSLVGDRPVRETRFVRVSAAVEKTVTLTVVSVR